MSVESRIGRSCEIHKPKVWLVYPMFWHLTDCSLFQWCWRQRSAAETLGERIRNPSASEFHKVYQWCNPAGQAKESRKQDTTIAIHGHTLSPLHLHRPILPTWYVLFVQWPRVESFRECALSNHLFLTCELLIIINDITWLPSIIST